MTPDPFASPFASPTPLLRLVLRVSNRPVGRGKDQSPPESPAEDDNLRRAVKMVKSLIDHVKSFAGHIDSANCG